jgi:hypothetical protein
MSLRDLLAAMWRDLKRLGKDPYSAVVFSNRDSGESVTLYCLVEDADRLAAKLRDEVLRLPDSSAVSVKVAPEAAAEWNAAFHDLAR